MMHSDRSMVGVSLILILGLVFAGCMEAERSKGWSDLRSSSGSKTCVGAGPSVLDGFYFDVEHERVWVNASVDTDAATVRLVVQDPQGIEVIRETRRGSWDVAKPIEGPERGTWEMTLTCTSEVPQEVEWTVSTRGLATTGVAD